MADELDDLPDVLGAPHRFPGPRHPKLYALMIERGLAERWGSPLRRLNWCLTHSRQILQAAVAYYRPVRVYACYSGGYDSGAAVSLTMNTLPWRPAYGLYDRADDPQRLTHVLHVNTGIGIEATRQYVRDVCAAREWPLLEAKTPCSYEDLVLGKAAGYKGGFPGPPMHAFMYQRLKERAIRLVVRAAKEERVADPKKRRAARVMLVSGIRHDESMIRAGYQRCVSRVDSQVWINPLYWATIDDFREIRKLYDIPHNPVKDVLGMSGECCCGAYAERGELLRIRMTCAATADHIEGLERRVRAAGFDWGWEDPGPPKPRAKKSECDVFVPGEEDFRPMCASCEKTKTVAMSR